MELHGTYDFNDLLNLIISEIQNQPIQTEEDKRILRHLTESQYQLKLKHEKELKEYQNNPQRNQY